MKEKEEIYAKYSDKINQNFELKPSNNISKVKSVNHDEIIKTALNTIKESEIEKYITDKLNINKHEYDGEDHDSND